MKALILKTKTLLFKNRIISIFYLGVTCLFVAFAIKQIIDLTQFILVSIFMLLCVIGNEIYTVNKNLENLNNKDLK